MKSPHFLLFLLLFLPAIGTPGAQAQTQTQIDVRPDGPIRTLEEGQAVARKSKVTTVVVHAGTYYLPQSLTFTAADSGTSYVAAPGEKPVISGGRKLALEWQPYKDGIMQAKVPAGLSIDQLFVNGACQTMARYPNEDPKIIPYGGFAADAISKERAARWADPTGGYIHALHGKLWGGFEYRITGKDASGNVTYEGGWQNNRPDSMHPTKRYVENIFEELDAPGEWFLNTKTGTLYYYPPQGLNLKTALIEAVGLRQLVEFKGAKNMTLKGFILRHAARTFMETKEPLLRSDWTIYRGGAVFFTGSEDCTIADCEFDQLGGNAVFVSGRNRGIRIVGCDFHDTGASAVAFAGDVAAVRSPLFSYGKHAKYAEIDRTPGPKTGDYPADCLVDDCLIRHVGVVEKQAAGVEVSMSQGITIRHCSIYDTSRAGINFGDGCWGGNVIEFCDVFDTVMETGDHGCFNAWGRDRYWRLEGPVDDPPKVALLDAVKPNIIRNSRWRCDKGFDVDLDDGSSNYEIYNNVFLHGGLKFREGYNRHATNNIGINSSLHPHVWFPDSGDVVTGNIWGGGYKAAMDLKKKWPQHVDNNFFPTERDRSVGLGAGWDATSMVGDPQFVDPAKGNYAVREGSPALKIGFKNFPMDQFGVMKPELRSIARTPVLPIPGDLSKNEKNAEPSPKSPKMIWLDATVRDVTDGEYSVFGVTQESGGVVLQRVTKKSPLGAAKLRNNDLIQRINGTPIHNLAELARVTPGGPLTIEYVRDQSTQKVTVTDPGTTQK